MDKVKSICATGAPLEKSTGARKESISTRTAKPLILLCATEFGELLAEVYPVAQISQPPRKVAPSLGAGAKAPLANPLYAFAGDRREQATPKDHHGNVVSSGAPLA
jgi:hypothetical protein